MNQRPSKAQQTKKDPAAVEVSAPASASLPRALWQGTCIRYTLLCLCLLLISAILADSLTVTYVDTVRFFLLLPFALCLTLATHVRRSDKLSGGVKGVLHPLLSLGGFYLTCYLPYQISTKPSGSQVLMILLLAAALYALGMGIFTLVTRKFRQKKLDDTPYVSQFGAK